jgi:glycosyltransferase involved in cell wall biosynthesis
MPDGQPWPLISIVTPSFNQAQFIEGTIRSILLQGYPGLEYIIIDGASTDNSVEIIKRYEPWLTYWVSEPDRGQSHAINKGFAHCTGELVNWINTDDRLLLGALQAIVMTAVKHPNAPAYVGSGKVVDTQGNVLRVDEPRGLRRTALGDWRKNGIWQPACFFRKSDLDRFGGTVNENLFVCFDLDLWLCLSTAGDFVRVKQTIAEITVHPDAKTQKEIGRMLVELVVVQAKNGFLEKAILGGMQIWSMYEELANKVQRLTTSFPYRLFRPLISIIRSSLK